MTTKTKGEIVTQALAELSLGDVQGFDITPEEKQRALVRLDGMVAQWASPSIGIRIGYASGGGLDEESGVTDAVAETLILNLAKRLAPGYGKTLSAQTLLAAKDGYDLLLIAAAYPPEQQLPHTTPRGQGNKPWRTANRPYLDRPDPDPLRNDPRSQNLDILEE